MMTTTNLLNLLLTIHITGLTLAGGMSLSNYFAVKKFWNIWSNDGSQVASTFIVALPQPSGFFWMGIAMLLISGGMMMHVAYQAFMMQFWFQAKMGLILLIIVNAIVIARQMTKLTAVVSNRAESRGNAGVIASAKQMISILSGLQLLFFLLIFVLAVFRF